MGAGQWRGCRQRLDIREVIPHQKTDPVASDLCAPPSGSEGRTLRELQRRKKDLVKRPGAEKGGGTGRQKSGAQRGRPRQGRRR